MATLSTALTFARTQAQTDSNGLTDTAGIVFANEALLDFANRLITDGVDASGTQESYATAVANQGTYSYPSNMWRLKTISLNLRDTIQQNYLQATQVDVSNLPDNGSFQWLRVNAAIDNPYFDDRGNTFEIFPTPTSGMNLTNAIYIFYFLEPTEFTATSDTISYPASLDYRILGWRIAANYLTSLGDLNRAQIFNQTYETKLKELVKTLGAGSQTPIQPQTIPWTGWQF